MRSRRGTGHMMANPGQIAETRERAAFWVRAAGLSAKEVGRAVGSSERTGQRIRDGLATSEHVTALAAAFKWRFVHFVFEPLCGPAAVARDQEVIDELTSRLARIEAAVCGPGSEGAHPRRELAHAPRDLVATEEVKP